MKPPKKAIVSLVLFSACLIIQMYSRDANRVEMGYSSGFSPWFSSVLRRTLGWLPFSIGDVCYGLLVAWLLYKLFVALFLIVKGKYCWMKWRQVDRWLGLFNALAFIYLIFNLFWGINYNRTGIAGQLNLQLDPYNKTDINHLNALLLQKANQSKAALLKNNQAYPKTSALFLRAGTVYQTATSSLPFLQYQPASIKSSLWGWLGNYAGFTGYYNPFTGEAQVNTTVPDFLQPFICLHEIAHQQGYAKEREANFVGFLAAIHARDTLFQYAAYLDMFVYANRQLYWVDSTLAKKYRQNLSPAIQADLKEWITFNRNHQSIAEPIVRWVYGLYLQGNQQPQGIHSYDEVTAFLISYYKKNKLLQPDDK